MDKLVLPRAARAAARLEDSPEAIVENVAAALDKDSTDVRIVVLDKPRHQHLIARLRSCGASVSTPPAGDVSGALAVLLPDGEADLLLGIGGTPEGVMAACAARALSGGMQGRLAPQREDERRAVEAAGLACDRVLELDELVAGEAVFVATGITGGLLRAPRRKGDWLVTDSIVIARDMVRRIQHSTPMED
jgi:fructose-1,6-bisphosphatase II